MYWHPLFSPWKELISFSCPQLSFPDRTSSHIEYRSHLLVLDWDTQTLTIAITLRMPNKYNQKYLIIRRMFSEHCMTCRHDAYLKGSVQDGSIVSKWKDFLFLHLYYLLFFTVCIFIFEKKNTCVCLLLSQMSHQINCLPQ